MQNLFSSTPNIVITLGFCVFFASMIFSRFATGDVRERIRKGRKWCGIGMLGLGVVALGVLAKVL